MYEFENQENNLNNVNEEAQKAQTDETVSAPEVNYVPGVVRQSVYTEKVQEEKKDKKGKRMMAAMVALAVLNVGLFGGAYFLGRSHGGESYRLSSKQNLVDALEGNQESTTPVSEVIHREGELATEDIAKQVGPAVVGITGTVENYMTIFGGGGESYTQGSGIILSEDGYIVTNQHVVDNTTSLTVVLNTGTEYEAKVIGADAQTDLAVVKITPTETLTVAKLGDSSGIEVGERVVAIGNPMGVEFFGSVTQGIISAVNRTITVDNRTLNLIQTDAAINTGNSGGALINAYGEVIGINSVKVTSTGVEGMGFAIPISEAKPIVTDLLQYGYVKGRPVIGISTRDVNEYMSLSYSWPMGAQVMDVTSEAARRAGLEQGDIITAVNGEKIETGERLNEIKENYKPGDVLKLDVYKYATGLNQTVEVTLSEQLPG